jgi:hypothetical protein
LVVLSGFLAPSAGLAAFAALFAARVARGKKAPTRIELV